MSFFLIPNLLFSVGLVKMQKNQRNLILNARVSSTIRSPLHPSALMQTSWNVHLSYPLRGLGRPLMLLILHGNGGLPTVLVWYSSYCLPTGDYFCSVHLSNISTYFLVPFWRISSHSMMLPNCFSQFRNDPFPVTS